MAKNIDLNLIQAHSSYQRQLDNTINLIIDENVVFLVVYTSEKKIKVLRCKTVEIDAKTYHVAEPKNKCFILDVYIGKSQLVESLGSLNVKERYFMINKITDFSLITPQDFRFEHELIFISN